MRSKTRTCHICGTETDTECPICTAAYEARRPAQEMTPEERATELDLLGGPLEIEFHKVHIRVEELVGRPVMTHEMADWGGLVAEARGGRQ